jgi:hypothetical protein
VIEVTPLTRRHGSGHIARAHAGERLGMIGLVRVAPLKLLDHGRELLAILGKGRVRGDLGN